MNEFKRLLKIILLFIILACIGALPIIINTIENKKRINEIHKSSLNEKEYELEDNLGVLENIDIIINARTAQSGFVIEQDVLILESEKDKFEHLIKQLKQLQALGVLPDIDFNQKDIGGKIAKQTYSYSQGSVKTVVLWRVELAGEDFMIEAIMAAEDYTVYEFSMSYKGEESLELSMNHYFTYLGLNQDCIIYTGNDLDEYYIYQDEEIHFTYRYQKYRDFISFHLEP